MGFIKLALPFTKRDRPSKEIDECPNDVKGRLDESRILSRFTFILTDYYRMRMGSDGKGRHKCNNPTFHLKVLPPSLFFYKEGGKKGVKERQIVFNIVFFTVR